MSLSRTQAWLGLCLMVALVAWARVSLTLADPGFDASDARGLLRSDPAVLFHFVDSILRAGGLPAEFPAHARLEAPDPMSIPALFPLGPEFLIALFHAAFGADQPLHISCLWFSSIAAACAAFGIALLARECGLGRHQALLAAGLALLLPGNQRTLGFLLVGEDYSFPLWLLHLGLALRAVRTRSGSMALASALTLLGSLSSWHAASFFLSVELGLSFALCWAHRLQPLATRNGRTAVALVALGSLAVPMLRHTAFALSLPMALACGMAVGGTRVRQALSVLAVLGAGLLWAASSGAGSGEYSHVFGLLAAKARHLFELPADPRELSPEVRLMWQGPFASLSPLTLLSLLGVGSLALLTSARGTVQAIRDGRRDPALALLGSLFFVGVLLALAIERVVILPAALAGVLLVRTLAQRPSWLLALLFVQALAALAHFHAWRNPWYQPPIRRAELRSAIAAVERLTPKDARILTDFVNGPALLAHTGRGILLQPKWETRRSRSRIEEFLALYFHGQPEELSRFMRDKGAEYLLVDRATLTLGMCYAAGLAPTAALPAGSPAALLGQFGAGAQPSLPGWELVYESPPTLLFSDGSPSRLFRLYRLK